MKAKQLTERVKGAVRARSGEVCEVCGGDRAVEMHHRAGRQMGGSRVAWVNEAANILHLCQPCHRMVTDTGGGRPTFEERGWLVRRGVRVADEVPVFMWVDSWGPCWVRLDDEGGHLRLSPDEVLALGVRVA